MIPIYVGFDPREAVAYHVWCQSVIEKTSVPVSFIPLHGPTMDFDGQQDGTNAFIYSRFLVPHLMGYQGWALFVDGDMVCNADIAELWALRDDTKAAMVVKHDYETKHERKYKGTPMEARNDSYPRKNWSSVILWNCGHKANKRLSKHCVATAGGKFLHRFEWLADSDIGELPRTWNHLVGEYDEHPAKLFHHTLGIPGIRHYSKRQAREWNDALLSTLTCVGENPSAMVRRALEQQEWL